jgi:hypothetical protein
LQLARVDLQAAVLPEEWREHAQYFWAAFTPLTSLTALEGCVTELGDGMFIGDGDADSWPVVSRLRRLCLGYTGTSVDGIEVYFCIQVSGNISGLTALEALWVDHEFGHVYPANLRELRVNSMYDAVPLLGAYSNITSLTLELHANAEVCFSNLPPLLKEMTLVEKGWVPRIRLGNMLPLPHLRRFIVHGFEVSLASMCCVLAMHPRLEEVHFYRPILQYFDGVDSEFRSDAADVLEHARCALGLFVRKPVVKVVEVDDSLKYLAIWVSPVVVGTWEA